MQLLLLFVQLCAIDEGDEEDSEVNLSEQVQALKLLKPVGMLSMCHMLTIIVL